MSIKNIANVFLKNHRYNGSKKRFDKLYQRIIKANNISLASLKDDGLINWLTKWGKYDKKLSPLCYQVFSHYIGNDINIIPDSILDSIIEPVLSPKLFRAQYADKNSFDILFCDLQMPRTVVRNIDGVFFDNNYHTISEPLLFINESQKTEKIILKPSREDSGHGVKLFELKNGQYYNSDGTILSLEYLEKKYKSNFLIQEAITQNPYMSQFNPSSVNTLRIATYKSVVTGNIHILNAGMRIGAKGSNVDNAHAGGMFIGINKDNGEMRHNVCDWLGRTKTTFNGIDFSNNRFLIPNWDEICGFAKQVSERVIFCNLVALDIALDELGHPILIEINIGGFGGWFFQFTTGSVFGEYTDEVMDYCWAKYKKLEPSVIM